jgi:hypothetical protein
MNAMGISLIFFCLVIFIAVNLRPLRANAAAAKPNYARLYRIQIVSALFRWLMYVGIIFQFYMLLAFLFGWPPPYRDQLKIVISQHHIYTSPAEMPQEILALWMVKVGLGIFCAVILSCLFRLYEKGILFSAKNTLYLRFLGYYMMIDWAVNYLMQGAERDMQLSTTPVMVGFLIIFIAWIMDEGRKIQEEQELTV